MSVPPIVTAHLELVSLPPEFFVAILNGPREAADAAANLRLPEDWPAETDVPWLRLRLSQLREDASIQPWLLRAMVLPSSQRPMVGYIGFHSRPLEEGVVEFGYTVLPLYRRRGFAFEAATALMEWGGRERGVRRHRLSIAPGNEPSQSLARKLGFRQVGSYVHEERGMELLFERDVTAAP